MLLKELFERYRVQLEQQYGITLSKENRALELLKRPEMNYRKLVALDGVGPGVADPLPDPRQLRQDDGCRSGFPNGIGRA